MRTTVNIDDQLLGEAKVIAARSHRSLGSVLEDALRAYIEERQHRDDAGDYQLPDFVPSEPGLQPGVDLEDREQIAALLDNDSSI